MCESAYYDLPHQLQTLRLIKMKNKKADADSLLTKRELAQKLKVSERTITNLTNSRMIPVIRMGYLVRYDYVECLKVLRNSHTVEAIRFEPRGGFNA